jgi:hypothetical protein
MQEALPNTLAAARAEAEAAMDAYERGVDRNEGLVAMSEALAWVDVLRVGEVSGASGDAFVNGVWEVQLMKQSIVAVEQLVARQQVPDVDPEILVLVPHEALVVQGGDDFEDIVVALGTYEAGVHVDVSSWFVAALPEEGPIGPSAGRKKGEGLDVVREELRERHVAAPIMRGRGKGRRDEVDRLVTVNSARTGAEPSE